MNDTTTETRSVTIEREVPFPPDRVWRALTRSELIEDWLMKNDFRPDAGHRFTLSADWGSVACEVLEVVPQEALSYTWETKDLRSVVSWTLTPTGTGTRLRMEQTGFRPDQRPYYQGATAGWPRFLDNLERVLAQAG